MMRTKYLFLILAISVGLALVVGLWVVYGQNNVVPVQNTAQSFRATEVTTYEVAPNTGSEAGAKRKAFIAKVREALLDEPVSGTQQVAEIEKSEEVIQTFGDISVEENEAGEIPAE